MSYFTVYLHPYEEIITTIDVKLVDIIDDFIVKPNFSDNATRKLGLSPEIIKSHADSIYRTISEIRVERFWDSIVKDLIGVYTSLKDIDASAGVLERLDSLWKDKRGVARFAVNDITFFEHPHDKALFHYISKPLKERLKSCNEIYNYFLLLHKLVPENKRVREKDVLIKMNIDRDDYDLGVVSLQYLVDRKLVKAYRHKGELYIG